jgi:hypothetical protein
VKKYWIYGSVLLLAILMSAAFFTSAAGISYKVGVSPGNWAEYSETTSLLPSAIKARVDIIGVNGTTVKLNETIYNANGTVAFRYSFSGDLAQPLGYLTLGFYLIPTNLSAGDYISGTSGYKINETVPMTVVGLQRLCNHLIIHTTALNTTISEDYYWDQATGILVKSASSITSPSTSLSSTTVMTATNVFSSAPLGTGTIILLGGGAAVGVVIVVALVAAYRLRRKSA